MPAPDLPTLYDFETQIESAFQSVLQAALLTASIVCQVIITRDSAIDDTPRIELQCTVGAPLSQRRGTGTIGVNYREIPIAFGFKLSATVITTRPTNDNEHGAIRGLTRFNLSAAANVITARNLPYLQILEMLPAGSPPAILDEKQQDKSLLEYDGWFAIQNSAWPT